MEINEDVQNENMQLLFEIFKMKVNLRELYIQKGPTSPDYISVSIKLDLLTEEYFEEKFLNLITVSKDELIRFRIKRDLKLIKASHKLDINPQKNKVTTGLDLKRDDVGMS